MTNTVSITKTKFGKRIGVVYDKLKRFDSYIHHSKEDTSGYDYILSGKYLQKDENEKEIKNNSELKNYLDSLKK